MHHRLPPLAIVLGVAGLIPFIGCGIAAISANEALGPRALAALIGYGAVILAFLGGVHWGLVLAPRPADSATPPVARENLLLLLGVVPSLIGWVALVLAPTIAPDAALAVLILGFLATVITEWRMRRQEIVPTAYLWLRWALSLVVVVTLVTVLAIDLLGAKIVL
jgi:hypothetical protein